MPGFAGPVEFEYRVADQFDETGTAFVRVGVIDQESNPSPVTYSDYVEVQAGATNTITVQPTANDIDPAGKKLEVTEVVPDAPVGTVEFDELQALIGSTQNGIVTLTAGEVLGSRSFIYTVTNPTGDTSSGLIVMKVVRESVPDHPRVVDTYLTIEDRSAFSTGIDVVTGKVTWNSGTIGDLKLSLWQSDSAYKVSGWTIAGALPEQSELIPFKLTGTNVLGTEVSTFGFLRIPGKDDVILALKSGTPPQTVLENKSTTFDLADLVSVPSGEKLEIDDENIRTAGKRAHATCTLDGTSELTYTSGAGSPWVDYCAVPARLVGQDDYTVLIVAIEVVPETPLPILHSAALTHSPAEVPITYDLQTMVDWAGNEDDEALKFEHSYSGDQFVVTREGSILTIYAVDVATAGRENTVRVSLSSHPDVASAGLSLKVGPAPTELPKGGTVVKECSQAGNATSCLIKVIGAPGEVNIYRGALTLDSVSAPASCTGVTMEVADASTVHASWTSDAPGAKCTGTFVVKDPRGQLSPEDRNGTVLLDLQGFAKAPSSVTQSAYDDGTITLSVNPGPASAAYPALTGFVIYRGSTVVSHCTTVGVCDPITGVSNGDKQTYEARSTNGLGDSKTSVSTLAWAYRPPVLERVTRETIYESGGGGTSNTEGWVLVTIESTDSSARGFMVTGSASEVSKTGTTTTKKVKLPVGVQTVTVTPVSEDDTPSGVGPTASTYSDSVAVAGRPLITGAGSVAATSETSVTVTAPSMSQNSGDALDVRYVAWRSGSTSCTADANGDLTVSTSGVASTTPLVSGLEENRLYTVKVCVSNSFGVAEVTVGTVRPFRVPDGPAGWTYAITQSGDDFTVSNITGPDEASGDYDSITSSGGSGASTFVKVKYCLQEDHSLCGVEVDVAPVDPLRVYQYQITNRVAPVCQIGYAPYPTIIASASPLTVGLTQYEALDEWPDFSPQTVTGPDFAVPADTERIRDIDYTVTFDSGGGSTYVYSDSFTNDYNC